MLAMDSKTPRLASKHALSLTTIASKLAPTGFVCRLIGNPLKRQPLLHHCQQIAFRQRHRVQLRRGLLDRL